MGTEAFDPEATSICSRSAPQSAQRSLIIVVCRHSVNSTSGELQKFRKLPQKSTKFLEFPSPFSNHRALFMQQLLHKSTSCVFQPLNFVASFRRLIETQNRSVRNLRALVDDPLQYFDLLVRRQDLLDFTHVLWKLGNQKEFCFGLLLKLWRFEEAGEEWRGVFD
jgi:hypothetical protein